MRNSKKAALLVAALLGFTAAAHAADIDTSKRIRVAMVPKLIGLSVFKANETGAVAAAKKLNINFLYTGPVTASAQGQVDVFNSLIARRFNVITTTANNPTELAPALRRAMKMGIKVVSYDSDVAPDAQAVATVINDQNGTITRSTRFGPKKSASQPPGTWPAA